MSILYTKTAILSRKERNEKMVTARVVKGGFPCSVQPVSDKDGITGGSMLTTQKLYTDYQDIQPWDRLEIGGVVYIVDSVQNWKGLRRSYKKIFINESKGT